MGFEDKVAEMETEIAELKNKLEDVEWDLHKSREKEVIERSGGWVGWVMSRGLWGCGGS